MICWLTKAIILEVWTSGVPWLISLSISYFVFCGCLSAPLLSPAPQNGPAVLGFKSQLLPHPEGGFQGKYELYTDWATLCLAKVLYADWLMPGFAEPIMWQRGWDYTSYLGAFRSHCWSCGHGAWGQFSWNQGYLGEGLASSIPWKVFHGRRMAWVDTKNTYFVKNIYISKKDIKHRTESF